MQSNIHILAGLKKRGPKPPKEFCDRTGEAGALEEIELPQNVQSNFIPIQICLPAGCLASSASRTTTSIALATFLALAILLALAIAFALTLALTLTV